MEASATGIPMRGKVEAGFYNGLTFGEADYEQFPTVPAVVAVQLMTHTARLDK